MLETNHWCAHGLVVACIEMSVARRAGTEPDAMRGRVLRLCFPIAPSGARGTVEQQEYLENGHQRNRRQASHYFRWEVANHCVMAALTLAGRSNISSCPPSMLTSVRSRPSAHIGSAKRLRRVAVYVALGVQEQHREAQGGRTGALQRRRQCFPRHSCTRRCRRRSPWHGKRQSRRRSLPGI